MALIKCKECGHEVSDKASACPNCGFPIGSYGATQEEMMDEDPPKEKSWIWGLIVVVLLCLLGGGYYAYTKLFKGESESDKDAIVEITPELIQPVHNTDKNSMVELTSEFIQSVQQYDELSPFFEGMAAVRKGGRWGFINTKGENIIACSYDEVHNFKDGISIVYKDSKHGLLNTKGEELFMGEYDDIRYFGNNLIGVRKGGKYGFIDIHGKEILPFKYDGCDGCGDADVVSVRQGQKYGLINLTGEEVFPCKYDFIPYNGFNNGISIVKNHEKFGCINTKGEELVPCVYDKAQNFLSGWVLLKRENKEEIVNAKKKYVDMSLFEQFSRVLPASEKLFKVRREDQWGYADENGNIVVPCEFDYVSEFREGFASGKKNGKYGFIDENGTVITSFIYDDCMGFSNGYCYVCKGNLWGIINTKGQEVVPCRYEPYFSDYYGNGVFLVRLSADGFYYYGYADLKGNDTFSKEIKEKVNKSREGLYQQLKEKESLQEDDETYNSSTTSNRINMTIHFTYGQHVDESGFVRLHTHDEGSWPSIKTAYSQLGMAYICSTNIEIGEGKTYMFLGYEVEDGHIMGLYYSKSNELVALSNNDGQAVILMPGKYYFTVVARIPGMYDEGDATCKVNFHFVEQSY